jgi:uncharacterized membrane protein YdfJ with MMPL/SSD domain
MSSHTGSRSIAARMGRWSATHWKTAVFGWLLFVAVSVALNGSIGLREIDPNDATVGESHTAEKIIREGRFNVGKDGKAIEKQQEFVLLQSTTRTAQDPAFQAAISDAVRTVGKFPQVEDVQSPLAPGHADLISPDRHSALVKFTPKGTLEEAEVYIDSIVEAVDRVESRHPGFYVESAGVSTDKRLNKEIQGGLGKAGLVSIPLTIVILLLITGSLVAALIPLLLGITAVLGTTGILALSSQTVPAADTIMEVVLLIGLAVGVDYSLFYMRRERQERAAGRAATAALEAAAATSGRAVLISGMTVLIAMAGMFLSGDKTFMSFSIGTMIVVAVAMLGSLTVLPAILGKLGDRVEKGRIPFLKRRGTRREGRLWGAVLDRVLRRPLVSAVAAVGVLVLLAMPTLQIHTTQTGMEGITTSAVEPFKRVIHAFPGTPVPAVVAVKADDVAAPDVRRAIADLKRKALASGQMNAPINIDVNGTKQVAEIDIPLAGNGVDAKSNAALETLRNDLLPATLGKLGGVQYAVTGAAANSHDFNQAQKSSIPKVFGFVLLFAFGLLLVSFRSIVIALKAIVLNLLSVAAAYGVIVALFQWGWAESLFNFESNGGIANWLPMFMFVILFGLSMDYHVFILSRIRESYDRGATTDEAIAFGIKSTAGVVTSAAVVMVGVFGVFTVIPLVDLIEMGVGLAAAVLIDATIVRAVLLPASMKLLGSANWYLPGWLSWLPQLDHSTEFHPTGVPAFERAG